MGESRLAGKALINEMNINSILDFALLSNRNDEFPDQLRYRNEYVINYLTKSIK